MKGPRSGTASASAGSVLDTACPAARRADCSLRTAVLGMAPRRNGVKESLTKCEIDIFLSVAPGDRVTVRDHETGALWHGRVDLTFPDQGFVWVITDTGERKLLDIGVHTIWLPEESGTCGSARREAGHGTGQLQSAR